MLEFLLIFVALIAAPHLWSANKKIAMSAGIFLLLLVGTYVKAVYFPETLRYRITVALDTPEGLKTGSAVREVKYWPACREAYCPHVYGEDVVVDLDRRGILVALSDRNNIAYGISYVATARMRGLLNRKAPAPVGTKWTLWPEAYPEFVAFKSSHDPITLKVLTPPENLSDHEFDQTLEKNIEDAFGTGVKIKEVNIEKTNDPATVQIKTILPWMNPPFPCDKNYPADDIARQHPYNTVFEKLYGCKSLDDHMKLAYKPQHRIVHPPASPIPKPTSP